MATNDFEDILKSAFGDDEKPAEPEKAAAKAAPSSTPEPAVPGAAQKTALPGRGKAPFKPLPGAGKFVRPVPSGGSSLSKAASPSGPPGSGTASVPAAKVPPAPITAPPAPAAALPPAPPAGAPLPVSGQATSNQSPLLLLLLLVIVFFSLLISAAALVKINHLQRDLGSLTMTISKVKESADRSWQIKCGVFAPVPNVRPQEYQIRYEEKDGNLIKKQLIIKPMEEKE